MATARACTQSKFLCQDIAPDSHAGTNRPDGGGGYSRNSCKLKCWSKLLLFNQSLHGEMDDDWLWTLHTSPINLRFLSRDILQLSHASSSTCSCQISNLLMPVLAHAISLPTCSWQFFILLMPIFQLAHAISLPTCSWQFSNLLMPSVLQFAHASSSPFSIGYHILPCNSRYTSHPLVMWGFQFLRVCKFRGPCFRPVLQHRQSEYSYNHIHIILITIFI